MTVQLIIVQGQPQGKLLTFPPGEFLFGRGTECHIRPRSDWVSRQHCLLRVTEQEVTLRDLGSRNGTLVNGERVRQERHLHEGDRIEIGPMIFQVRRKLRKEDGLPTVPYLTAPPLAPSEEDDGLPPGTSEYPPFAERLGNAPP